jgi:hypothetical protein
MRLLLLALLLASSSLHAASGFSHSVAMDPETRDSITVSSFMDNLPTVGFMPLRVVIDNRSTEDRQWALDPRSIGIGADWISASWTFPVKAGSKAEFDILVPMKSNNFNYRWGAQFSWIGPGVDSPLMQLPQTSNNSNSGNTPFLGLSDSLHAKHWGTLQAADANLLATSLDLSQAPADWRAYIGLDQIWMTAQEWLAFPGDKKQALKQALALGSDIAFICKTNDEASLIRQSFNHPDITTSWRVGASHIDLVFDDTNSSTQIKNLLRKTNGKAALLEGHNLSSYLDQAVAEISTAGPLVLIFIILFGIIAGPVNLFVLAPSGRRHRLFITTPVISFIGAIILAAAIFIQDGTGGSGIRLLHVQVLPDQKQLVIQQEQASRTGLLVGSSFQPPPGTWVQPLFSGTIGPQFSRSNGRHSIDSSGTFFGDWFRSRTRQNQLVTTVRPSRAAIEFTPGTTPSIVSSIEVPLHEIYIRDPDGALWRAKNVRPGTRMTLTREISGMDWWKDQISDYHLSGIITATAETPTHPRGTFYATATEPGSLPIETLPSIRWKTPITLLSGPLTLR